MNDEPTYLKLLDNYRVCRCDERNFEVEEFREVVARPNRYIKKETRSKKWVSLGYYSELSQAVNGVLKMEESKISAKKKMDLENFVVELKRVSEELITNVHNSGIKVEHFTKTKDLRGKTPAKDTVVKSKQLTASTDSNSIVKRGRGRPKINT